MVKIFKSKTVKMEEAKYRLMHIQAIREGKSIYEILDSIIEIGLPVYFKRKKVKPKFGKNKKRQGFTDKEIEEMTEL